MAAPLKPWELGPQTNMLNRSIPGLASTSSYLGAGSPQDQLLGNISGLPGGLAGPRTTPAAPPLPPRPQQQAGSYSRFGGGYGGGYSSMHSSPFSSMYSSPYSSMYGSSGYGYGGGYGSYNRFGGYPGSDMYGAPAGGGFVQMAEESSQQAFQSIESIVHAVGSVSMMLESTFHAVYSSFRAVIGVADHFSRMKAQIGQFFSILALLRALRWLFRRAIYLLGLSKTDPRSEKVWAAAGSMPLNPSLLSENDIKQNKFNWPILLFFAMVFGTPWVIWKLLSSLNRLTKPESNDWASGQADHFVATASYDFTSDSEQEVSFRAGQEILLAPKELQPKVRGWLLASVGGHKGLVPANYLQIQGKRKGVGTEVEVNASGCDTNLEASFQEVSSSSSPV